MKEKRVRAPKERGPGEAVRRWPKTIRLDMAAMAANTGNGSDSHEGRVGYRVTIDRMHYEARADASPNSIVENPNLDITLSDSQGKYFEEVPVGSVAGTKQFPAFFRAPIIVDGGEVLVLEGTNKMTAIHSLVLVLQGTEERL